MGSPVEILEVSTFGKPLAVIAAEGRGLLEHQGLLVRYDQTQSSSQQIQELFAGRWDLAHTAVDNVIAHVDGGLTDLRVILVLEIGLPMKLMLRAGLSNYDDLRGQDLGVDAPATGYAFVLYEMLSRNGLAPTDFKTVAIGGTAQRGRALAQGQIAGTLLSSPHDGPAIAAGCTVLDEAAAYFPAYPSISVAATRHHSLERANTFARYCRALMVAEAWAMHPSNGSSMIDMISQSRGVDRLTAAKQYKVEAGPRVLALPSISEVLESIELVRSLRRRMTRNVTGRGSLQDYFDDRFMAAAQRPLDGALA